MDNALDTMQRLKIEASDPNQAFSNRQESSVILEYSDDSDFSDDDYYGFEDGMIFHIKYSSCMFDFSFSNACIYLSCS